MAGPSSSLVCFRGERRLVALASSSAANCDLSSGTDPHDPAGTYGSWLMSSAGPRGRALPATTSPPTGLYTSDAALTRSTTRRLSPATRRPAPASPTNTRVAQRLLAWSEMPTVMVPIASRRAHSWDLKESQVAGTLLLVCLREGLASREKRLSEGRRRSCRGARTVAAHGCRQQPAADLDFASGRWSARARAPARSSARGWGERAAGDLTLGPPPAPLPSVRAQHGRSERIRPTAGCGHAMRLLRASAPRR